jgi:hypothetical protein
MKRNIEISKDHPEYGRILKFENDYNKLNKEIKTLQAELIWNSGNLILYRKLDRKKEQLTLLVENYARTLTAFFDLYDHDFYNIQL